MDEETLKGLYEMISDEVQWNEKLNGIADDADKELDAVRAKIQDEQIRDEIELLSGRLCRNCEYRGFLLGIIAAQKLRKAEAAICSLCE